MTPRMNEAWLGGKVLDNHLFAAHEDNAWEVRHA